MSDKEHTRFRLNLPHFSIELSGDREFVEELYRKVYRDLLPLIEAGANSGATIPVTQSAPAQTSASTIPAGPEASSKLPRNDYTWIYNCTPHYNKVYVVENQLIWHTYYGRILDPRRLRRIYVDRERKSKLFHELAAGNRTLWAEITPEGRRMIEEAAQKRQDSLDK